MLTMAEFAKDNKVLTELCGIPISLHRVNGADIFYTDGAASGATFRLHMPDSSMVYLCADGSAHIVRDSPLFIKYAATIQQHISSLNYVV